MGKFRPGKDRQQITFLPPSLEEYVSSEDTVRFVDAIIEELDLASIERAYSEIGRPAFSPRVLSKIILYGKMRGVRSCRELSRAAKENVKFMYLANDEKPDFRTINLFRKRFHRELSQLLGQTVQIALREGVLSLEHVAIDSTKLRGYASKKSYQEPKELERIIREIESSFEKDIEADDNEGDDEPTLPPNLRSREKLREKARAAVASYEAMKEQNRDKKAPQKVSITDPECRYLAGGTAPVRGYRLQAAVDSKSRLVVGGYATHSSDNSQLIPMLEEIKKNARRNPREVSADKGYSNFFGIQALKERGILGFVPIREDFKCSVRMKVPGETIEEMIKRTKSPLGQEKKTLRSSTIEPLFGHYKHARCLIRTFFRGIAMVTTDWRLELAAFNIEKLARLRLPSQLRMS